MEPFRPAFIHAYDIEITQGQDFAMGFRAMPRTDDGVLYLEDTTGYTATMKVRDGDYDGDVVLEASTADGRIAVGFSPVIWEDTTAYTVGQKVVPTELNGYVYEVTVAGTSHASTEPTWPTTIGATVVDATVTWRAETTDATVTNVYIQIAASVTAGLTDWGRGVYNLEVTDTFDHSWLFVDGVCRLRREGGILITARPPHIIVNEQSQPVRIYRVHGATLLLPSRHSEAFEQGANEALIYPPPVPTGFAVVGNALATGKTHLGSDGAAVHALGTTTVGTASATGKVATGTAGAGYFLVQESGTTAQAWGQDTTARRAQSFEVDGSETLNVVSLQLTKVASPTDDISVEIHSNSTNKPSGTVLESTNTINGATLTGSAVWYDFTLDAPLALSSSTQYWICIGRSGVPDNTNFYRWLRSAADIEAGWLTSIYTSSWSAGASSWDLTFRLS